jgi:hypothetical protein
MAEVDKLGDSLPVGMGPGTAQPSPGPAGGAYQITGDSVPLSHSPVPPAPAAWKGGEIQSTGDKVALGSTPIKGYGNAANLAMSQRTDEQSKPGRK